MTDIRNNKTVDYCDLLAAYELNLLETTERLGFENHLSQCNECLEEMYAMAPAMLELSSHPGEYAAQAARYLELDNARSWWSRLGRLIQAGPAAMLIPVGVAAVLAMLIFMPHSSDPGFRPLAMIEAPAYAPIQMRAGQQEPWVALWDQGMDSYNQRQYQKAASDLTRAAKLLSPTPTAGINHEADLDNLNLYLGVSLLLSDQSIAALAPLQKASQSSLGPVRQKALWFLAQAHLINEQPQDALKALAPLLQSPVYAEDATLLTNEINSRLPN